MYIEKILDFFGLEPINGKNYKLAIQISLITLIIFLCLGFLVQTGTWNHWDINFSLLLHKTFENDFLDTIAIYINDEFSVGIWIDLGFLLCIPKKTRKLGILLIATELIASVLFEGALKFAVSRVRPYKYLNLDTLTNLPSGYSFPSGHTMAAFVGAMTLFIYNKKIGAFAFGFAFSVAFMRVYIYAHFLSDVFMGAVLGIAISLVVYLVLTEAWDKVFDLAHEQPLPNR